MPTLDQQLQQAVQSVQKQVAPALGADIAEVWRAPAAVVAGGSGVDQYGYPVAVSTNTQRPDENRVRIAAYYCRLSANNMAQVQQFGGQNVVVAPYVLSFNAADKPDIAGTDLIRIAAKRQSSLAVGALGWQASTNYAAGALEQPSAGSTKFYRANVAGTTGSVEPVWPQTSGGTVVDGGVTWVCIGDKRTFEIVDPGGLETIQVERIVLCKELKA